MPIRLTHPGSVRSTMTRLRLWEDWYCGCLVPTEHGQASFHAFRIDGMKEGYGEEDFDDGNVEEEDSNAQEALKGTQLWVGGAISVTDSATKHVPLTIWNTRNAPLLGQEIDDAALAHRQNGFRPRL